SWSSVGWATSARIARTARSPPPSCSLRLTDPEPSAPLPGDAEPEAGPGPLRLGADAAAVGFDELLDDGEADAGTAAGTIARLLDAVEALEDVRQGVRRGRLARGG